MASFPTLCWSTRVPPAPSSLWESGRAPWGKTHKSMCVWGGLPKTRPFLTLTLRFVYREPPAIDQLLLSFSYLVIGSQGFLFLGFYYGKLWFCYLSVSSVWGVAIFFLTLSLWWLKEELLILFVQLFMSLGWWWWLLSSLHAVLETRIPLTWIKAASFLSILSLCFIFFITPKLLTESL